MPVVTGAAQYPEGVLDAIAAKGFRYWQWMHCRWQKRPVL